MRTIDNKATAEASWLERTTQNLWLLRRMAGMVLAYVVAGGRIRRRYEAKAARGEILWVDEEL